MKPSKTRLKDVLDDKPTFQKWREIFGKMRRLGTAIEMYTILITGNRKITTKMIDAIRNGIKRCNNNPRFNDVVRAEQEAKLKPILEKIVMVERLAEAKGDKGQTFVRSIKQYVQMNYRITKKQMEGLNKVYKRCSEDLFKGDDNEGK